MTLADNSIPFSSVFEGFYIKNGADSDAMQCIKSFCFNVWLAKKHFQDLPINCKQWLPLNIQCLIL